MLLLDSNTPGLEWIRYRTHDGRSAADLICTDVPLTEQHILGPRDTGLDAIELAVDGAIAASCAEAVRAMEALNTATLEYLKTRQQFGQPIGRFQVLQHRMADMINATWGMSTITSALSAICCFWKLRRNVPNARSRD